MRKSMTQGTLVTAASAALLFLSAGQARSQETARDEERLPILIQEDLYLLQLGIAVDVEVRCNPSEDTRGGREMGETADRGGVAVASVGYADLGPCGMVDGETRVHRLLEDLQVRSDLAQAMKESLEQALRERIEQRIRDNITDRVNRRLGVSDEGLEPR